jgi:hypothetical protein
MIESKDKAKEILEYCANYLIVVGKDRLKFKTSKMYKEMLKEIEFLIDTD